MIWVVGLAFVAVQLLIGAWASRSVRNESDFLVAGRRIGPGLLTFSLFATWFGAETCLGSSGAVYSEGLSGARADPLGYSGCLILLGLVLAKGLYSGGYLTLADLFRCKFGPGIEHLVVLLLVPSGLVWGAAQVRAFGQILAATTDLPVVPAVWVGALVSIAYTSWGGLLGDVVTDAVQGLLVMLGLALLGYFAWKNAPSDELIRAALSPARLSFVAPSESIWQAVDRALVPVLGSLVAQELVARVLAARSVAVAQKSAYFSAGLYLLVGCVPVGLGLVGPAYVSSLADPEQLLVVLAERFLGPVLSLVFAFALLAAILSTIDSILLSTSALVSHNLLVPLIQKRAPAHLERATLWSGRLVLGAAGLFCLAVALYADGIYSLVEAASALGTAGVLVATLAALFDPRPSARGAFAALVLGGAATPLFDVAGVSTPYLGSIATAIAGYLVGRQRKKYR